MHWSTLLKLASGLQSELGSITYSRIVIINVFAAQKVIEIEIDFFINVHIITHFAQLWMELKLELELNKGIDLNPVCNFVGMHCTVQTHRKF